MKINFLNTSSYVETEDWRTCEYCGLRYPPSDMRGILCKHDVGACNKDHVCSPKGIACGWLKKEDR